MYRLPTTHYIQHGPNGRLPIPATQWSTELLQMSVPSAPPTCLLLPDEPLTDAHDLAELTAHLASPPSPYSVVQWDQVAQVALDIPLNHSVVCRIPGLIDPAMVPVLYAWSEQFRVLSIIKPAISADMHTDQYLVAIDFRPAVATLTPPIAQIPNYFITSILELNMIFTQELLDRKNRILAAQTKGYVVHQRRCAAWLAKFRPEHKVATSASTADQAQLIQSGEDSTSA